MRQRLTAIGFDADDTLWHNERFFHLTQDHFAGLLAEYTEQNHLMERLLAAERRNLPHYGFGIKGFTLSMIETAVEVTEGKVPASVIDEILTVGRDMLSHAVELLPHAQDVLEALKGHYNLILITKGDLLHQESKVAQSGLRDFFDGVEIVSRKSKVEYADIFARHGQGAGAGLMVGNSMASDVVPMIEAGGWGVHVPHDLTWAVEHAEEPTTHPRFKAISDLGELPDFISEIVRRGSD